MAENLWALREQKKVSVAALANRAGLPIGLIMEYESGQRSIDPRHLGRLARALYVDEAEIKLQSDPRPGAGPARAAPAANPSSASISECSRRPARPGQRASRRQDQRASAQARAAPAGALPGPARSPTFRPCWASSAASAELEAELGKPLGESGSGGDERVAAIAAGRSARALPSNGIGRICPESVDTFEARYLTEVQEAGAVLRFTLFDGSTDEGQVIGFSPYSITIRALDGAERTLNKLALVSYSRRACRTAGADGSRSHEPGRLSPPAARPGRRRHAAGDRSRHRAAPGNLPAHGAALPRRR